MLTVAEHPQLESIVSMLEAGMRGREIVDWLEDNNYPPLRRKQVNDYYRRHVADDGDDRAQVHIETEDDDVEEQLSKAKRLIERAREEGLDPKSVRVETGGSEWDAYGKDQDGKTIPDKKRSDRKKVTLTVSEPTAASGARVEIRQAEPVTIDWKPEKPTYESDWRWAVIMPDAQRPFEDEGAVDVSLQILAEVQREHGVDRIIHLGDDLDLPEFGRHRTAPEALGALNQAFTSQHETLAKERAICPDAQIDWLEGNHETRLVTWLVDNCDQLIGVRRAGAPEEEPVLSIPFLCRLDEIDVNYIAPYPEGEIWLNSNFRAIHGDVAKGAKGATAAGYLAKGDVSTVYGHIHRSELVYTTRHTKRGPRTYLAGSPGCLCDIGGRVPSAKSGINADGRHGRLRTEDWQQGIWVVSYETSGKELYNVEQVQIWGGEATFRGHTYVAS